MRALMICHLALISLAGCTSLQQHDVTPHEIVVLHTNDTHGHPFRFFDVAGPEAGGLAARATIVANERKRAETVLVLDAGDINTGLPESNLFQAEPDILGMNRIGYDAVALGNHEFDRSLEVLRRQGALARFSFLSANIKAKEGKPIAKPFIVRDTPGARLCVFGLTTKDTQVIGEPSVVSGLVIEDEIVAARKTVSDLKSKEACDVVIALSHLGVDEPEVPAARLARSVPGIDLIVDGHSHTRMSEPLIVEGVPIVQAWQWGLEVGKAVLTVQNGKVTQFKWQAIPVNVKQKIKKDNGSSEWRMVGEAVAEDPGMLQLLKPYQEKTQAFLNEEVAVCRGDFSNKKVREQETALGDLVADSMKDALSSRGVVLAFNNNGSIRASLPEGAVTLRSVYSVLPYDNTLVMMDVTGVELLALCDFTAKTFGQGAFPSFSSGVEMELDSKAHLCKSMRLDGVVVDKERSYRIVTNSFIASGGDGYRFLKNAKATYDTSIIARDAFAAYIKKYSPVSPQSGTRLRIVNDSALDEEYRYDLFPEIRRPEQRGLVGLQMQKFQRGFSNQALSCR